MYKPMNYEEIIVEASDGVAVITINRPEHANKLTFTTAKELYDALRAVREDPTLDVAILTGAGDKFFCIGGEHEELERLDYSNVMPVVDLYEMIDTMPKPVIAAVNGFAVGGGNVLQVVCDLSVAVPGAIFRQVGPMVGSFDAGYGTWYLEELIGRRRAKEFWYLNRKYTAQQALDFGLINEVCEEGVSALDRAKEIAAEIRRRGPFAIASLKTAFSGRHTGVVGQARLAHDLLLTAYRGGQESKEISASFDERRDPDRDKFYR
ncbi:enoyl-CoA hydratase-related protein [Terrabacter terrigena]|uniref:Enoyl-CoA hydratase-related protein n=1 Tax=Terrabacter terrigena TaxID=574718 RepID=A0ABW3N3F1_9MICO